MSCGYRNAAVNSYMANFRRILANFILSLAQQKESRVEGGHLQLDHVHLLVSIPLKNSGSSSWLEKNKHHRVDSPGPGRFQGWIFFIFLCNSNDFTP